MNDQKQNTHQPPKWAKQLLVWFCNPELLPEIQGDLHELFQRWVTENGLWKARWQYWLHVISFFRPFVIKKEKSVYIINHTDMFENYFKIAFRSLRSKKFYAAINILGLALGIGGCIAAFRWVEHELSYDRFHKQAHLIYRVLLTDTEDGPLYQSANDPALLGLKLSEELPQIENFTRISFLNNIKIFSYEDKTLENAEYIFTDPSFFEMFSFPLIKGNPAKALADPHSVVVTEQMAKNLFGEDDPLGKEITVNTDQNLVVTGILQDPPSNSHLQFDFLLPMSFFITNERYDGQFNTWRNSGSNTYVQLMRSANPEEISRQAAEMYVRNAGRLKGEPFDFDISTYKIKLQPLTQIHLHSSAINADKISNNTDIKYIYIFSSAAIILLIIACINFINIETSRAAIRAKEVGVRKVLGAARGQLVKQFFAESTVITFLSMLLGLLLVYFFLPYFIEFTWKDLLEDFVNPYFITGLLAIFIGTSLLSGMYPALILSSFYPLKALRQKIVPTSQKAVFRRVLVMTQFVASILLVICALVVNGQLHYIKNKPLGYAKENLISIPIKGEARQKTEVIKNELVAYGEVKNVTLCSEVLVDIKNNTELEASGVNSENHPKISYIFADEDFFQTYQLEVLDGRIFSTNPSSDKKSFVLNESAAKLLGEDSPVGKTITINGNMEGEVMGVVKNFHFKSLHQKIEPCVIVNNPPNWGINQFVVRLSEHNVSETLEHMQQIFKKANPAYGFEYHFVDQSLNALYISEARMGKFLDYFGLLTLIVAGLGLFGLASFLTQQKAKEVAVRKVLGATSWHIILLNVREFMILLFFAALVGVPVGYYFMNDWLQNFSYRINMGVVFPIIALLLTLLTVLLAVAYHTILLSSTRPAEVLKNE